MRYTKAVIQAIGYELPPNVVSSEALEDRLAPVYDKLGLAPGQLEALTGIRERRWWDRGFRLTDGAIRAGKKALEGSGVRPQDIGAVVYGGVCRENFEPASACRVADGLGIRGAAEVFDVSNACLGVLSGILEVANKIELGQIRAGLVVSCESARDINEIAIERMLESAGMESFKESLATLTGGSGAVAVLVTDGSFGKGHRLLGGVVRAAPEHHAICRWGLSGESAHASRPHPSPLPKGEGDVLVRGALMEVMETDAIAVLKNGVTLGKLTWDGLMRELSWTPERIDKVICHQVGSANREEILKAIRIPVEKDFSTYEFLGNIGTVSLPLTAALANEREFLSPGDRVAWLGIGSGLNCLMLGLEW